MTIAEGTNSRRSFPWRSLVAAALFLGAFLPKFGSAQTLAFPGAFGFGAKATGGRGGTVYHVTTLADSGAGSFRDAVSQGNRTVVFDVGGYILLNSAVSCANNLTIAGQTAPGGGIGFMGHEISFSARNNEIVRFLRIRPGSLAATTEDGINFGDGTNMIFDHISIEFAPYNSIDAHGSAGGANQISFQNSILADPIHQQFNAHTEALGNTFFWWNNIFANSHNRNPLAKVNTIYVNNIIYNFQAGYTVANTSGNFSHDIISNYFISGPSTSTASDDFFQMNSKQKIYAVGNLLDSDRNGSLGGSTTTPGSITVLAAPWSSLTPALPIVSTVTAYKNALSQAGAQPLDQVDLLVLRDVASLGMSGQLWTSQTATGLGNSGYGAIPGGTALVDTDGDGMSDIWESASSLNPNNAGDGATITPSGYTQLEIYLNWLANPHAIVPTNSTTDIDLWTFTRGFTNGATYTVSNPSNGTIAVVNGHFARFAPTVNFSGVAGFNFNVVDNAGGTLSNRFGLLVTSVHIPQNLVWQGDGTANTWDVAATNWWNGASVAAFSSGDNVTFDDSGSNTPAINVPAAVSISALTVDSSQDYSVSGTGALNGGMTLVKSGPGALLLATTNSYTGGTILNEGTLTLGTVGAAGGGTITCNGGALSLTGSGGPATYANSLSLIFPLTIFTPGSGNNNQALSGAWSGSANVSINTADGGTFSARGSLSGYSGTILLTGSGNFRFQGSAGAASVAFDLGTTGATMFARDGGTITLGSLAGGPNTWLRGAGSTAATTTYIIGGNNLNTTFAGTITNGNVSGSSVATAITKNGTGTLTLTGTNNYSGTTSVTNGVLVINGSNFGTGGVTATNVGTISGGGYIAGLLTVNGGGKLAPGDGVGTITAGGGLTLNGGRLVFDLAKSTTAGNGVNDFITMNGGTLTLSGVTTVVPNLLDGTLANGTYTLVAGGGSVVGGAANLAWGGGSGGRQSFSFDTTTQPGSVFLNVGGVPAAALVWRGTNGTGWDTSTTNWVNLGAGDKFLPLDAVTFDDTAATGTVVASGTVQPGLMTVSNTALTYTVGGGQIGGSTRVIKGGSGTLFLNATSNSFSGGVMIFGGAVVVNTNDSLGSGTVTLAGGALVSPGGNFSNNIVCLGSGALGGNTNNHLYLYRPVSGNGVLNVNPPSGRLLTIQSDFSGFAGTCVMTGAGRLRFNQGGYVWGNSNVLFDAGLFGTIQNRSLAAVNVYLGGLAGGAGSTLSGSDQTNNPGAVDAYFVGALNSNTVFHGAIQDGSTHILALWKTGTGTLTLTGNNSYSGDTTVNAGTLVVNNTSGSATGSGGVTVNNGATLAGSGSIGGVVAVAAGGILAPGQMTLQSDLSLDSACVLRFAAGPTSSVVNVTGDLSLEGTLQVSAAPGFQPGAYTLFNYGGTLNLGALTIGAAPAPYTYAIDVSIPGQVNLLVSLPQFSNVVAASGALVFSGAGGNSNASFYLLTSTNLATPLSNWTRLLTNQFDSSGSFNLTNPANPNTPQSFYLLQLP